MTTDPNEIARLEGEVRGLKFRLAELQADQTYANKCARDEELAAVAIHVEAVALAYTAFRSSDRSNESRDDTRRACGAPPLVHRARLRQASRA